MQFYIFLSKILDIKKKKKSFESFECFILSLLFSTELIQFLHEKFPILIFKILYEK